MNVRVFDPKDVRDIGPECTDEWGNLKIMPARYYAATTAEERAWFGHRFGFYSLPTVELCEFLTQFIGPRSALEIGAGHGALAKAVGIRATDSYLQLSPDIVEYYRITRQPTTRFPDHVEKIEALAAVKQYQPQVIVGCWITHRYDPKRHAAGGNMYGPDIPEILKRCEHYVLIGNEKTHANNPLLASADEMHFPPWLYSRAMSAREFIAVWKGDRLHGS